MNHPTRERGLRGDPRPLSLAGAFDSSFLSHFPQKEMSGKGRVAVITGASSGAPFALLASRECTELKSDNRHRASFGCRAVKGGMEGRSVWSTSRCIEGDGFDVRG